MLGREAVRFSTGWRPSLRHCFRQEVAVLSGATVIVKPLSMIGYVAERFKRQRLFKTEAECVFLSAMEALAAALPANPP
jgi:hypothetical protein